MKPTRSLLLLRFGLSLALFASAALVIDYLNPGDPAFCGVQSACMKVRTSDVGKRIAETLWALIPGATLPQVALLGFVALLAMSFFATTRARVQMLAGASVVAGLVGLGLIAAQAHAGAYCAYCMVVDSASILAGFAGSRLLAHVRTSEDVASLEPALATPVTLGWGGVAAALTVLPFVWARFPEVPPLPPALAELQVPGKTTIVSFTDFECPYCRQIHPAIEEAKARPDVVVRRFMVPLEGHLGAMPAALGYTCTPPDKQDAMAHALYETDPGLLTTKGVLVVGEGLGVPREELNACMGDPATRAKVLAERALFFDGIGGQGLPTTYVGERLVKGAQIAKLKSLVEQGGRSSIVLPVWSLFALSGALLLAIVARQLRSERAATATPSKTDDAGASDEAASSATATDAGARDPAEG
jgi:hypothetical protein